MDTFIFNTVQNRLSTTFAHFQYFLLESSHNSLNHSHGISSVWSAVC